MPGRKKMGVIMEWKGGEERAGGGAEGAPTGWLSCVLANG